MGEFSDWTLGDDVLGHYFGESVRYYASDSYTTIPAEVTRDTSRRDDDADSEGYEGASVVTINGSDLPSSSTDPQAGIGHRVDVLAVEGSTTWVAYAVVERTDHPGGKVSLHLQRIEPEQMKSYGGGS